MLHSWSRPHHKNHCAISLDFLKCVTSFRHWFFTFYDNPVNYSIRGHSFQPDYIYPSLLGLDRGWNFSSWWLNRWNSSLDIGLCSPCHYGSALVEDFAQMTLWIIMCMVLTRINTHDMAIYLWPFNKQIRCDMTLDNSMVTLTWTLSFNLFVKTVVKGWEKISYGNILLVCAF